MTTARPTVLFVHASDTAASQIVVDTISDVLRQRGCAVQEAQIEVVDARDAKRFSDAPLRFVARAVVRSMPSRVRGTAGEIRVPEAAKQGEYDLICVGSSSWFVRSSLPIRAYFKSQFAYRMFVDCPFVTVVVSPRYWRLNQAAAKRLARAQGGRYLAGLHVAAPPSRTGWLGPLLGDVDRTSCDLPLVKAFAGRVADRIFGARGEPEMGRQPVPAVRSRLTLVGAGGTGLRPTPSPGAGDIPTPRAN